MLVLFAWGIAVPPAVSRQKLCELGNQCLLPFRQLEYNIFLLISQILIKLLIYHND